MTATTRPEKSVREPTRDVACEWGKKEWQLAMTSGLGVDPWWRTVASGDWRGVERALAQGRARFGLPAVGPVLSCSEAGRDGLWIPRALEQRGLGHRVVDSASIEVHRRARRAHTDRRDARTRVRRLVRVCAGDRDAWSEVRVPSVAVPTPDNSGESEREPGISRAGNHRWPSISIQLAWNGVRWQPHSALTPWYREPVGTGTRARRIGIVAVARKLVIARWRSVTTGVVPAGAILKAASIGERVVDASHARGTHGIVLGRFTRLPRRRCCSPRVRIATASSLGAARSARARREGERWVTNPGLTRTRVRIGDPARMGVHTHDAHATAAWIEGTR